MLNRDRPIIIIGAGPVGLVTAFLLREQGIPCVVLEQDAALPQDLRASTFHPPTLDMLGRHGFTSSLVEHGRICNKWQIRMHQTGEFAEFDMSVLEGVTDHPYRLQCEQSFLTQIVHDRIKADVDVLFSHTVTAVSQDDDGVAVEADTPAGRVTFHGSLLIGADGARSFVRGQIEQNFDGTTYPETVVLATTRFPFEDHIPNLANVTYIWLPNGTVTLLRLHDRWRCSLYPDQGLTAEQMLEPDNVERKLQEVVPRAERYEVLETRAYRVHMRIVEDYRKGRIVLVGDAAHINSPSGGMGMNCGVHDAFSLSATIGEIWNGGPLDLLDRYTRQRRPIAESEILAQADRNRARMQERDPGKRRDMLLELKRISSDRDLARAYLMKSSLIDSLAKSANIQ